MQTRKGGEKMHLRKASSKFILFSLFVLIVVIIFGVIFTAMQGDKKEIPDDSSDSNIIADESSNLTSFEEPSKEFKKIEYDVEHALTGRMGYSETKKEMGLKDQESYQLEPTINAETGEPLTISTGHILYRSKTNENLYIISGETPVGYANGKVMPLKFLREENTGIRIRTFNNQSELESFKRNWESGQRILNKETVADAGSVIIDGCLTDVKFERVDGDVRFNILGAMKEIVPDSYYNNGDGFFYVFMDGLDAERIPTTSIPHVYETYEVNPLTNTFLFKGVSDGKSFEYRMKLIDESDMMVKGKDIHVILGWEFYTNGDVLSIVTAPENVSNKAVVYSFTGNSGYITKIVNNGDGSYSVNTYDTDGNLVSSEPFDTSKEDSLLTLPDNEISSEISLPDKEVKDNSESNSEPNSEFDYFSDKNIVV